MYLNLLHSWLFCSRNSVRALIEHAKDCYLQCFSEWTGRCDVVWGCPAEQCLPHWLHVPPPTPTPSWFTSTMLRGLDSVPILMQLLIAIMIPMSVLRRHPHKHPHDGEDGEEGGGGEGRGHSTAVSRRDRGQMKFSPQRIVSRLSRMTSTMKMPTLHLPYTTYTPPTEVTGITEVWWRRGAGRSAPTLLFETFPPPPPGGTHVVSAAIGNWQNKTDAKADAQGPIKCGRPGSGGLASFS